MTFETFKTWYFFITIIAFPGAVINSHWGVLSRLMNRRATKSRESYEKRLKYLKEKFERIKRYRNSSSDFFREQTPQFMRLLLVLLIGIFIFFVSFVMGIEGGPRERDVVPKVIQYIASFFPMLSFFMAFEIYRLSRQVNSMELAGFEAIDFVVKAKKKGLHSKAADEFVLDIMYNDMLTEEGARKVKDYLNEKQVKHKVKIIDFKPEPSKPTLVTRYD